MNDSSEEILMKYWFNISHSIEFCSTQIIIIFKIVITKTVSLMTQKSKDCSYNGLLKGHNHRLTSSKEEKERLKQKEHISEGGKRSIYIELQILTTGNLKRSMRGE